MSEFLQASFPPICHRRRASQSTARDVALHVTFETWKQRKSNDGLEKIVADSRDLVEGPQLAAQRPTIERDVCLRRASNANRITFPEETFG